jgi:hypothetical protein
MAAAALAKGMNVHASGLVGALAVGRAPHSKRLCFLLYSRWVLLQTHSLIAHWPSVCPTPTTVNRPQQGGRGRRLWLDGATGEGNASKGAGLSHAHTR